MAEEKNQEQNLSQLLQIRRDKLMGERFTRFLKAVNAAGNGVEMNKFYLDQLSTHPDLTSPNVLDVLRELSEVATLAVVTNGFDRVQSRRVRESGILDFVEDVFVSEKMDSEKPNRKIFDAALRALGVENREHVLMVGGIPAGITPTTSRIPARSFLPMRSAAWKSFTRW